MNRFRHHHGQSGSSLILVLVLVAVLSLLVPTALQLAGTGLRVTTPVVRNRSEIYAATSAIEAAIANGRYNTDIGMPGAPCPDQSLSVNSFDVTIECENYPLQEDGCHYLDRFATFLAVVRSPGDSSVLATASAEVAYRFKPDGTPKVEVRQFMSHASGPVTNGPVTTAPLPSCNDTPPTTASTTTTTTTTLPPTTTTTTTTTTQPPLIRIYAKWGEVKALRPKNNKWQATGQVDVRDGNRTAVQGVKVDVRVEHLVDGSTTWVTDPAVSGTTDSTGSVKFQSETFGTTGKKRVVKVRFTITGVTKSGHQWVSGVNPTTVEINIP